MIELKFFGDAAVVRDEMLALLGMNKSWSTAAAASGPIEIVEQGSVEPAASAVTVVATEAPKPRGRRGTKTEEPAAPFEPAASEPSEAASAEPETAKTADAPAPTEKTTAPTSSLDFVKDVRPAFEAFGKLVGPTPLQALVASFGVRRASEIPAERFPEVLKAIADKTAEAMKG